jgi:hypothetical protein
MHTELADEGHGDAVQFVIVNDKNASGSVTNLTNVFQQPVFQDTSEVDAWGLQGGGKDDIFIYEQGSLFAFLPQGGAISISLGTPTGYDNVKDAILEALAAP